MSERMFDIGGEIAAGPDAESATAGARLVALEIVARAHRIKEAKKS